MRGKDKQKLKYRTEWRLKELSKLNILFLHFVSYRTVVGVSSGGNNHAYYDKKHYKLRKQKYQLRHSVPLFEQCVYNNTCHVESVWEPPKEGYISIAEQKEESQQHTAGQLKAIQKFEKMEEQKRYWIGRARQFIHDLCV